MNYLKNSSLNELNSKTEITKSSLGTAGKISEDYLV